MSVHLNLKGTMCHWLVNAVKRTYQKACDWTPLLPCPAYMLALINTRGVVFNYKRRC